MKCGECEYFIEDYKNAGMCVIASGKICASRGCTGLPFKRVFAHDNACENFKKRSQS